MLTFHIGYLREHPLFEGFNPEQLQDALLRLSACRQEFLDNEMILQEGETTTRLWMVLSGSVRIEKNTCNGSRLLLSRIETGGIFAESYALVPGQPLLVTVFAAEKSQILSMDLKPLLNDVILEKWGGLLLRNLLKMTGRKNLQLSRRSFHTSGKRIRDRVLSYLEDEAAQRGCLEFDLPLDRQQMADYLNLDRSALSAELGRMEREGLILFHKNHFLLRKKAF